MTNNKSDVKLYSEEEAREILEQALAIQMKGRDFSHTDLERMAEELGISSGQLQAAEASWLSQNNQRAEREAFIAHRRRKFKNGVVAYFFVNAFLFLLNLVINVISGEWFFWAIFPMLGWGMGLAFHWYNSIQTEGEKFEKKFAKWRATRQLPT